MTNPSISEQLERKIAFVAGSKRRIVRRLTKEEADQIRSSDGWQNGWFRGPAGTQIVLEQRGNGQEVIFRIG